MITVPTQKLMAAFVTLAVSLGAPVAACMPQWSLFGCSRPSAADEYTAVRYVDAEQVSDLRIEWNTGKAIVRVADDKELDGQIVIAETAPEGWHDTLHMSIENKDGELVVRYGDFSSIGTEAPHVGAQEKTLTVTLPKSCADRLDTITLGGLSGSYTLSDMTCKALNVRFEAGTVLAKGVAAQDLLFSARSGQLNFDGSVSSSIDVRVTSGSARVYTDATPERVDLQASSGSIDLFLPRSAGFTAQVKVGAGSFGCGFATVEREGKLIAGDGKMALNVDVSSGTVHIGKRWP